MMEVKINNVDLEKIDQISKKITDILQDYKNNIYDFPLILLEGDLGVGKTTFTRFFLSNNNVKGKVTSPTFSIVKEYNNGETSFFHLDAYRLENSEDEDLGLDEIINSNSIKLIEWPNFIDGVLNKNYLKIKFYFNKDKRNLDIVYNGNDEKFLKLMKSLKN